MLLEEQIQRELVRLLNKWTEGYETTLLEEFAKWTDEHLLSPYKIVHKPGNYGRGDMWVLEEKNE